MIVYQFQAEGELLLQKSLHSVIWHTFVIVVNKNNKTSPIKSNISLDLTAITIGGLRKERHCECNKCPVKKGSCF